MRLETQARDCLYLNWALPFEHAPPVPEPLRYEVHDWQDGRWVFVSALLFRLTELHLRALPWGRLAYPQANIRVYVLDGEDHPSVFFLRTLVPLWMVPAARSVGRQPVRSARLRYPRPSRPGSGDCWRWEVRDDATLAVMAKLGTPRIGPGPRLGSWDGTVAHFRQRSRGYVSRGGEVRAVRTAHAPVEIWPLVTEIEDAGLLAATVPGAPAGTWAAPHSTWLCPQIPFRFELGKMVDRALADARMPAAEGV